MSGHTRWRPIANEIDGPGMGRVRAQSLRDQAAAQRAALTLTVPR